MKVMENAVFKKSMCITYYRSLQMQYEGKLKLVLPYRSKRISNYMISHFYVIISAKLLTVVLATFLAAMAILDSK